MRTLKFSISSSYKKMWLETSNTLITVHSDIKKRRDMVSNLIVSAK